MPWNLNSIQLPSPSTNILNEAEGSIEDVLDGLVNLQRDMPSSPTMYMDMASLYALHEIFWFSEKKPVTWKILADFERYMKNEAKNLQTEFDLLFAKTQDLRNAFVSLFGDNLWGPVTDQEIELDLANGVHDLAMAKEGGGGKLRRISAAPSGDTMGFRYVEPQEIPAEAQKLFDDLSAATRSATSAADWFKCAAFFLSEFLRVHPYPDGNGRTARLLCSLLLVRSGYLRVPLFFNFDRRDNARRSRTLCRDEYLSGLESARGDNARPDLLASVLILMADRTCRIWLAPENTVLLPLNVGDSNS